MDGRDAALPINTPEGEGEWEGTVWGRGDGDLISRPFVLTGGLKKTAGLTVCVCMRKCRRSAVLVEFSSQLTPETNY